MSPEGLLTVISVFLAVVALIPKERADDLRVRLGGTPTAVAIATLGLLTYWSLLEPLHSLPGLRALPRPLAWLPGWDPSSASLLLLVLLSAYAAWRYTHRISVSRIPVLAAAISDAIIRRRHEEALHLLDAHLAALKSALDGDYWTLRLRRRLYPTVAELHLLSLKDRQRHASRLPKVSRLKTGGLSISIPDPPEPPRLARWFIDRSNRPMDAAHDIVRTISISPRLIDDLTMSNPYLGLSVMRLDSGWAVREFAERYAATLLGDPHTAFYRELRRAENIDAEGVPIVDSREQPILTALIADVVAENETRFFYTFVEAGINPLRFDRSPPLNRLLHGSLEDFHETGRWTCPPFAAIYLHSIVAPSNALAAEAPILNLYTLDTLASALLAQYPEAHKLDSIEEWPTPTHFLLYEIVSVLRELVRIWQRHPDRLVPLEAQRQRQDAPRHLPEHANDVLGRVMARCLRSEKLSARFKGHLLAVWWHVYWERYKEKWDHSEDVLGSLIRGGHFAQEDKAHLEGLAAALEYIDLIDRTGPAGDLLRGRAGLPPE